LGAILSTKLNGTLSLPSANLVLHDSYDKGGIFVHFKNCMPDQFFSKGRVICFIQI
jgi:hypothetical protein